MLTIVPSRWSRCARAATAATMLLVGSIARAQTPSEPRDTMFIGVGVAMGRITASGDVPVYGGDAACGEFGDGAGLAIAPSVVLRLPALLARSIGLGVRAGYIVESVASKATPSDPQRAVDERTGELVDVTRELRLETSRSRIALDLFGSIGFEHLSVDVGPSVWTRVGGSDVMTDEIVEPTTATFREGARQQDVVGATVLTQSAFGVDGIARVSFSMNLGARARLAPYVGARMSFGSSHSEYMRSGLTIDAGIDLLYDVSTTPTPPPVVVLQPPPEPIGVIPEPSMTASLRSLDTNGDLIESAAEVVYREVIERRHVPLLPVVFFDSGAARLPARARVYTGDDIPGDIVAAMADLGAVEAQSHVLNIIGERLRANPNLSVALAASTSSDEPRSLGDARRDAIRRYLVDVWRVNPSQVKDAGDGGGIRLSSESTSEGREENRRVQLIAKDPSVLRAVTVERRIGQAIMPLRLVHSVSVGGAISGWTVRLTDNARELIRIDSSRAMVDTVTLHPQELDRRTTTINAIYSAKLTDGRILTSTTSIPVVWRREQTILEGSTVRGADGERTTWQILGFGFDSPELLERHLDEVRAIATLVRDGARVVVTGFSDRVGEETRNRELSRQRAESVAAQLRAELARRSTSVASIVANGAGVDESRFNNDLPEGRMLSRGVTILVEQ